jgi:hypothetical protein
MPHVPRVEREQRGAVARLVHAVVAAAERHA